MLQRQLGSEGFEASSIGLGCMGMSEFYGSSNGAINMAVLKRAIELGMTFWDTSDIYGPWTNEQLLGDFFRHNPGTRQKVQLATKFGIVRSEQGEYLGVNGHPDYVKKACDASLQRLGVDHIDLYYQHRVDQTVPIEDTVGAMAELVQAGKVSYLGLSEASHRTIARAHKIHPLTAVQMEYSLWSREVEAEVLPICQQLGISLVAYSPLGRGFLTGAIRQRSDLEPDDWRLNSPRFAEDVFDINLKVVEALTHMAEEQGYSAAQLALAWLHAQDSMLVPIPGTRDLQRLEDNAAAAHIQLKEDDLNRIAAILAQNPVTGNRYPETRQSGLFADTPEPAIG